MPVTTCPRHPGVQAKAELGTGVHTARLLSGHSPASLVGCLEG